MQFSRRAFFGGGRPGQGNPVRPPWAIPEADFIDRCTRCNDCIDACPTHLLVKGTGSYPEADFSLGRAPQGCTFCGDCLRACVPHALCAESNAAPWDLRAVIGKDCLAERQVVCYTCRESCEAGAIHFQLSLGGIARPLLDEARCTGCGACLSDCPSQAISIARSTSNSIAFRGAA